MALRELEIWSHCNHFALKNKNERFREFFSAIQSTVSHQFFVCLLLVIGICLLFGTK
jgi:hypothetical protein